MTDAIVEHQVRGLQLVGNLLVARTILDAMARHNIVKLEIQPALQISAGLYEKKHSHVSILVG